MKDLSLFVKINTYGVVFTIIAIFFICYTGIKALIYPNKEFGGLDALKVPEIKYFDFEKYPSLLGILSGGFYLHNISLPMLRNC
jgi:hypothetical protein